MIPDMKKKQLRVGNSNCYVYLAEELEEKRYKDWVEWSDRPHEGKEDKL